MLNCRSSIIAYEAMAIGIGLLLLVCPLDWLVFGLYAKIALFCLDKIDLNPSQARDVVELRATLAALCSVDSLKTLIHHSLRSYSAWKRNLALHESA